MNDMGDEIMEKQKPVIGLPRAMLYYRYRVLWRAFFQELGIEVEELV